MDATNFYLEDENLVIEGLLEMLKEHGPNYKNPELQGDVKDLYDTLIYAIISLFLDEDLINLEDEQDFVSYLEGLAQKETVTPEVEEANFWLLSDFDTTMLKPVLGERFELEFSPLNQQLVISDKEGEGEGTVVRILPNEIRVFMEDNSYRNLLLKPALVDFISANEEWSDSQTPIVFANDEETNDTEITPLPDVTELVNVLGNQYQLTYNGEEDYFTIKNPAENSTLLHIFKENINCYFPSKGKQQPFKEYWALLLYPMLIRLIHLDESGWFEKDVEFIYHDDVE